MTSRATSAAPAVDCDARHAEMCGVEAPGHAVYAMQERVAAATPRQWDDAIVARVEPGRVIAWSLDGDALAIAVHGDVDVAPGEPIAVHRPAALAVIGGATRSARIR